MTTFDLDRTTLPAQAASADPPPSLTDLLDMAIIHADTQRTELAQAGDLDALAVGLHNIREVQRKLAILASQIDADVSRLNLARPREDGPLTIDGLGTLETKRRSAKKRWDSEALFGRLVDRICDEGFVDPHTGERVGDPATAARIAQGLRDRLAKAVPLTPSMGWRIGGLRDNGIDPDDYCEREVGAWSTRIIGAEET